MAKVYVSSTIADMERERRVVLDWLRLARHQAVDSYLPGSDVVRDSCLDDVAACDLYVLIAGLAARLGARDGGDPVGAVAAAGAAGSPRERKTPAAAAARQRPAPRAAHPQTPSSRW